MKKLALSLTARDGNWSAILLLPESEQPVPAVLLLNKASGNRTVYQELAIQLAERGIASLRLDLSDVRDRLKE